MGIMVTALALVVGGAAMVYMVRSARARRRSEPVVSHPPEDCFRATGEPSVIWDLAEGRVEPGRSRENRASARRGFLKDLGAGVLALLVVNLDARGIPSKKLRGWLDKKRPLDTSRNAISHLESVQHQDRPHTDSGHSDSPPHHVDVPGPSNSHYDTTVPHLDSHGDAPHGDAQQQPPPKSDKQHGDVA